MSEEEIIKYAKIFSTAHGDTFKIHFNDKTINEPDVWKGVLDYIDKLQKENQELQERNKYQYKLLEKFEEHIDKETIMKIYDEE